MRYTHFWDRYRVLQVLTTESRQKRRELFLSTHFPFKKIFVDFYKDLGISGVFIHEKELMDIMHFIPQVEGNRIFFIVGESGSGKSEICQWIEYNIDPERFFPVHIPKSMTNSIHFAILLNRVVESCSLRPLRRTPIDVLTRHIIASAIVLLYETRGYDFRPFEKWVKFVESDEIYHLITIYLRDILSKDHASPLFHDDEVISLLSRYGLDPCSSLVEFRKIFEKAIEKSLWLTDIRLLVSDISSVASRQGRRLLLLFDDITQSHLMIEGLFDFLFDLTCGNMSVVFGVTSGFERNIPANLMQIGDLTSIRQRLRGRFVLTDEDGRSYGLEDDLVGFTRAYLSEIGIDHSLLMREPFYSAFSNGLYPFTETALRRAFFSLREDGVSRQTPRLFLEQVIAPALLSETPPPVTFDQSIYLHTPPLLFRTDEIPDPTLRSLIRWYGEIHDDAITLDVRIAEAWDIPLPEHACQEFVYRIPRLYVSPAPEIAAHSDWQQKLIELQTWLDRGGMYPSRETLKRGIERVILAFGDPRVLGNPVATAPDRAYIAYARGDERLPICLGRDSGDQPATPTYIKVQVSGTLEERGILEELAWLAMSGKTLSHVCQNLALTLDWAHRHWQAYHQEIRSLLTDHLNGVTIEQLIWLSWRMLGGLCGSLWEERPWLKSCGDSNKPYDHITPWSFQHHTTCYTTGETLMQHYDILRRLFVGMFTIHTSLLDDERCNAAKRDTASIKVLEQIARIHLKDSRKLPYKIYPTGNSLFDILMPIQRYTVALTQLDVQNALSSDLSNLNQKRNHLMAQSSFDNSLFCCYLSVLRQRCGSLNLTWQKHWDSALDTLSSIKKEDFDRLLHDIEFAFTQAYGQEIVKEYDIWEYQKFRHLIKPIMHHPYWSAVEVLQSIQRDLLKNARAIYRRKGKMITTTRDYRQLAGCIRDVWREIFDG